MPERSARALIRSTLRYVGTIGGPCVLSVYAKSNYVLVDVLGRETSTRKANISLSSRTLGITIQGTQALRITRRTRFMRDGLFSRVRGVICKARCVGEATMGSAMGVARYRGDGEGCDETCSVVVSGPPCVPATRVRSLVSRMGLRSPHVTLSNVRSKLCFCETVAGRTRSRLIPNN